MIIIGPGGPPPHRWDRFWGGRYMEVLRQDGCRCRCPCHRYYRCLTPTTMMCRRSGSGSVPWAMNHSYCRCQYRHFLHSDSGSYPWGVSHAYCRHRRRPKRPRLGQAEPRRQSPSPRRVECSVALRSLSPPFAGRDWPVGLLLHYRAARSASPAAAATSFQDRCISAAAGAVLLARRIRSVSR
jgi:hypothetical protein